MSYPGFFSKATSIQLYLTLSLTSVNPIPTTGSSQVAMAACVSSEQSHRQTPALSLVCWSIPGPESSPSQPWVPHMTMRDGYSLLWFAERPSFILNQHELPSVSIRMRCFLSRIHFLFDKNGDNAVPGSGHTDLKFRHSRGRGRGRWISVT